MALKKYIIKQTTNWNGRGEKSGTSVVQMDEADIGGYIALLDGKIEVFEQNLTLSVDASTSTTSLDIADQIRLSHAGIHKTLYIQNSNRRPIVFKSEAKVVKAYLESITPFSAPHSADKPKDASIDFGNINLF